MNFNMGTLMNMLKQKNPQGYNMINQLRQSGGNPNDLLKQVMGKASPEQRQQLLNTAKSYRLP